jgi:hypothetical protein
MSMGHEYGQKQRISPEGMPMTQAIDRSTKEAELYMRLGFAFGR